MNELAALLLKFAECALDLGPGRLGRQSYTGYYSFAVSDSPMEGRLGAINAPQITGWGPGRYVAFTKTAIELTPGVEGIEEENSFHVIEGSW